MDASEQWFVAMGGCLLGCFLFFCAALFCAWKVLHA